MGLETEFGISVPQDSGANPMLLSADLVTAYSNFIYPDQRIRWDYDLENPLRDARGFDASRADADPTLLTDDISTLNLILPNGGRFYVDHAHPEYSSPEVTTPQQAVLWDKAGEFIAYHASELSGFINGEIYLHKNNTDNKSVSYGTHENYLVLRKVPFSKIVEVMTTFFISRQIFTGAGRLGIGAIDPQFNFQISQRADFFETLVGLETTMRRPIINTRDEPHADPNLYRRLHVIIGDANLNENATLLKMGTTSLILGLIEDNFFEQFALRIKDPLGELKNVSRDLTLKHKILMESGRSLTALEIQKYFLEDVKTWLSIKGEVDSETQEVLDLWEKIIALLDSDIQKAAPYIDWISKYQLLKNLKDRDGLSWSDDRLQMLDLQYSDLNPKRSIYKLMLKKNSINRLFDEEQVSHAVNQPPETTRAWFRGTCLNKFTKNIAGASWDSLIFDVSPDQPLVRIPTTDPLKGNRLQTEALFQQCASVNDLLTRISEIKL